MSEPITEKYLLGMDLHHVTNDLNSDYIITRVIGGWIYKNWNGDPNNVSIDGGVFVPEPPNSEVEDETK